MRGQIRSGQHVLVNGATGAIGSAAVQAIKGLGASVTVVCGAPHLDLVKGRGADRVIDNTAEDFTQDEQSYNVVFDAVGKSSFGRCKRLLKPRGIYLSSDLGPLSQNPLLALITPLLGGTAARAARFRGLFRSMPTILRVPPWVPVGARQRTVAGVAARAEWEWFVRRVGRGAQVGGGSGAAGSGCAVNLPQPGQLARPVLENHRQICRHRTFDPSTAAGTRVIRSSPAGSAPPSPPPPAR